MFLSIHISQNNAKTGEFSIANLNSTLMWNLILQIHFLSIVEFILSEPSVKIMVINMTVSSQREGTTYG